MEAVRIWEEEVSIPTYEVGAPDKNPMFLEKRVYQGSSGKLYPYPTTETISTQKKDKIWHAVYLENEYLKIMVLPELGGRIQRAYDKTNDYDFVYYNHVIKPALVGLAGPWISGGIEFNWPQHHRPTTYMPVDHKIVENKDGSKTLMINDVDQMYGTKGMASFTLYPGKAYIEIRGQLYNRTSMPQTFLWWANPAVPVNDYTQSIFPPDVHSVYDHGKRDVSRFPIAKGIYYKHDYSEGVDISRYKNIPVPTSYMAETSSYDFVGGYDYKKEAGLLHVADHHFSPGKKQWTWGCGDFGKAWDRNLTDEDGPYIELMTGVYTENQPDFTWLKPFEEKVFKQYFMPYKKVGQVKNATIHAALGVVTTENEVKITVYATEKYEDAVIVVTNDGKEILRETATISPQDILEKSVETVVAREQDICTSVYSNDGKLLVRYQAEEEKIPELAKPAEAAKQPEEIMTNEELLLTAQHIEQHRHATYMPDPYYEEGLKRDPYDSRINNAYGMLMLRRSNFEKAKELFRTAIKRLTWRSPNPYTSEPYYNLGLALFYQKKTDEAYDAFYKATWSNEQQEMSFYYLAVIEAGRKNYESALELVEKGLVKNMHNVKARGLKAVILRKLGRTDEAEQWINENHKVDPFDYVSYMEKSFIDAENSDIIRQQMNDLMRNFRENYLQTARDYSEAGFYEEAYAVLEEYNGKWPMVEYYKGYLMKLMGNEDGAKEKFKEAEKCNPTYCFPNKLEDIFVLKAAISANPDGAKAYYYLGNLLYDKLQFDDAIKCWEVSAELDENYPTVHRNLAIAYYNRCHDAQSALKHLEKAFELDENDSRVFLELDQLYKKMGTDFEKRLKKYEMHKETVELRDDVMLEYVTLYNMTGQYQKAYDTIMSHKFRPWEGAEGRISGQYKIALVQLAKQAIMQKEYENALELLKKSLEYPLNLGEGRLEGTKDNNIHYYLGNVYTALGDNDMADKEYSLATLGVDEPAGAMYYYDQPADMIMYKGLAYRALGDEQSACRCFNKLMDYGERHLYDDVKNDFFAVSLPDFMVFEDDMNIRNKAHCYYLMGLADLGFGEKEKAKEEFEKALTYDYNHQNCRIYMN